MAGRPTAGRTMTGSPSSPARLPVRVNHLPVITSSGAYDVGRVSHFTIVDGPPPIPSGVLCLAELDENDVGLDVLEAVARGQLWAFSRAEISLTGHPAFRNCRAVEWGAGRTEHMAPATLVRQSAPDRVAEG
jgi:hypothetical protein